MDFTQLIGYFTGLLFIKPDMDAQTLWRTAALIHMLEATLCQVIANHTGRNKWLWSLAGLLFGYPALGALFILGSNNPTKNASTS